MNSGAEMSSIRVLRLADTADGVFLSMPEVLAPLSPEAHALRWSILDLREVIADERWDLNLAFIEQRVIGSPTGMELSFEELCGFGERVSQVIDGLFVGCDPSARFPRRTDDDRAILENSNMLVAAIDSTFWLVSAADEVAARIERRFHAVTEEDPASAQLSTWGRD
jgi:hypothetical protein